MMPRAPKKSNPSTYMLFEKHLEELGFEFQKEYRFHPERRWRHDYYLPQLRIGIEIEGGVFSGGRHIRGTGFSKDCFKYNTATMMGIRVLRFTTQQVNKGEAKAFLEHWLNNESN
jgi:hypothetical protein